MPDSLVPKLAIGLMSGTSRDGIDAALIETDGDRIVVPIAFTSREYDPDTRKLIGAACDVAMQANSPKSDPMISACEARVTELHSKLLRELLDDAKVDRTRVHAIGFHGHTVAHRYDLGWTWQIGDAHALANEFGTTVVHDLRGNDMAHGGQGAPLLPVYHKAVLASDEANTAVLNLGGVANLTWLGKDGSICAFDCGMASALIDDWVTSNCSVPYDAEGSIAATGTPDQVALTRMLDSPFFSAPYPKSLDRADFGLDEVGDLSPADGAATLTAFSAKAVAIGLSQLPGKVDRLIVTGGGRKNATMMSMIAECSKIGPLPTEAFGWNGDAIEAQGFAYMAIRRLNGLPNTFPETTGVSRPMVGGCVVLPDPRGERSAA